MNVLVPFADGFEEIEALSIVDILRRADLKVVTAGLLKKSVKGAHEVMVQTDAHLDDINSKDFVAIVLPGGMPGASNLSKSERLKAILQDMDKENKLLCAICAAPLALMSAGVLKKTYTCYPSFENVIQKDGYINNKNIVVDENTITSQGPATAMIFALEIVKQLKGDGVYKKVKNELLA